MQYPLVMFPGNRLRELRKRAKLTQSRLAELTGVSQAAISQIENGAQPLNVEWMRTFARVFECAPSDLLSDADNPDRLADDERRMLELYRAFSPDQQANLLRVNEAIRAFGAEPRKAA